MPTKEEEAQQRILKIKSQYLENQDIQAKLPSMTKEDKAKLYEKLVEEIKLLQQFIDDNDFLNRRDLYSKQEELLAIESLDENLHPIYRVLSDLTGMAVEVDLERRFDQWCEDEELDEEYIKGIDPEVIKEVKDETRIEVRKELNALLIPDTEENRDLRFHLVDSMHEHQRDTYLNVYDEKYKPMGVSPYAPAIDRITIDLLLNKLHPNNMPIEQAIMEDQDGTQIANIYEARTDEGFIYSPPKEKSGVGTVKVTKSGTEVTTESVKPFPPVRLVFTGISNCTPVLIKHSNGDVALLHISPITSQSGKTMFDTMSNALETIKHLEAGGSVEVIVMDNRGNFNKELLMRLLKERNLTLSSDIHPKRPEHLSSGERHSIYYLPDENTAYIYGEDHGLKQMPNVIEGLEHSRKPITDDNIKSLRRSLNKIKTTKESVLRLKDFIDFYKQGSQEAEGQRVYDREMLIEHLSKVMIEALNESGELRYSIALNSINEFLNKPENLQLKNDVVQKVAIALDTNQEEVLNQIKQCSDDSTAKAQMTQQFKKPSQERSLEDSNQDPLSKSSDEESKSGLGRDHKM